MAIDERIRRELERAARPADPAGIYEELIRRRERRRLAHRMQAGVLAFVVFVGSIGGYIVLTRLFNPTDPAGSVAAGPDLGVLFADELDGRWDIFAATPGFDSVTNLTNDTAQDAAPTVSPDGTRIAFVRYDEANRTADLYVMDRDGTNVRRLTEGRRADSPSWSPDGAAIAFVDDAEIWVASADGLDPIALTSGGRDDDPDWSPDGSTIVFSRSGNEGPQLFVVPATGGTPTQLTRGPELRYEPTWSPSGDHVAFTTGRDIGVLDISTGIDVTLTTPDPQDHYDRGPAWAPDGEFILFASSRGGGDVLRPYVMDATGSNIIPAFEWEFSFCCPDMEWVSGQLAPASSPTLATEPLPAGAVDVGLGLALCDVTSARGQFAPGVNGTAYVGTVASDACPKLGRGTQVLALDADDDGAAESSIDLDGCDPFCSAFAAPEVDGDGTDEVLVQNVQFSIAGVRLYDVVGDPVEIRAVTVRSPGYPEGGLPAGTPPQFWIGGDGFNLDSLRCAGKQRVLIQTSATMRPPDSPNAVWRAHEATLLLHGDATLEILGTRTFEEPVGAEPSFAQGSDVCGAALPGVG